MNKYLACALVATALADYCISSHSCLDPLNNGSTSISGLNADTGASPTADIGATSGTSFIDPSITMKVLVSACLVSAGICKSKVGGVKQKSPKTFTSTALHASSTVSESKEYENSSSLEEEEAYVDVSTDSAHHIELTLSGLCDSINTPSSICGLALNVLISVHFKDMTTNLMNEIAIRLRKLYLLEQEKR